MADRTAIRALTVRQPWAWAIAHGGKNVENRSRRTHYRGPLLIHAGATWSIRGQRDPRIRALPIDLRDSGHAQAAFVAVADLIDCHPGVGCCEPWGETSYSHADGRTVDEVWHYVLGTVVPLEEPVACPGRLGLWVPPIELATLAIERMAAADV